MTYLTIVCSAPPVHDGPHLEYQIQVDYVSCTTFSRRSNLTKGRSRYPIALQHDQFFSVASIIEIRSTSVNPVVCSSE
jgi:hypothetical protein